MYEKIYDILNENGIDVHTPGTSIGECVSQYVVIKDAGAAKHTSFSTQIQYYDLLLYVPRSRYSTLEDFVVNVKKIMKKLDPMVQDTYQDQPSYYDDEYKAHMKSIMYKVYKKI